MGFRLWEKSRGIWSERSFSSLLYGLTMLIVVGLLCSQILGAFACQLFFDVAFFSSNSALNIEDPSVINSLKCIQFLNAIGVFIFPSCLFFHFRDLPLLDRLNLNQSLSLGRVFFLFLLALAMIPAANILGSLNEGIYLPDFLYFLKEIEAETIVLTEQLMKMESYIDLFQIIILVGILAALGEELLFRGLLQNLFQEWWAKKHLAVWLTAFLFSVVHLQYQAVLPRFLLGALIGYVYMNSGNLRTAILLHFFYNTSLVILTFMIQHQTLDASWEFVGVDNILFGVIALLFTIWIGFRSASKIM
tara:strand:- start:703 stop:1614 length:912 start_codon:yes stop_codon:yes gene_type:complete